MVGDDVLDDVGGAMACGMAGILGEQLRAENLTYVELLVTSNGCSSFYCSFQPLGCRSHTVVTQIQLTDVGMLQCKLESTCRGMRAARRSHQQLQYGTLQALWSGYLTMQLASRL